MKKRLSIAIIGEGETEWFYFESLRVAKRYPFKVAPALAQHADIGHMLKLVEHFVKDGFDQVFCLLDMDRLLRVPKEMQVYKNAKRKYSKNRSTTVSFIETNPCTEFWFLLHFLPGLTSKNYSTYEDILPDLRRYLPGYEKTKRYLGRNNLYQFLCKEGDLQRAMQNSETLRKLSLERPEDYRSYSEINQVLKALDDLVEG